MNSNPPHYPHAQQITRDTSKGESPEQICKSRTWPSLPLPPPTRPPPEPSLDDLFELQTTLTPEGAGEALGTLSEPTVYSTYTSISLALEKLSHPPCVHCALVPIILLVIGTAGEFPYPAFPRGWSWRAAEQMGQSVPSCWQQGSESRIPGSVSGGLFSADFLLSQHSLR